jgi:hypothetical protein
VRHGFMMPTSTAYSPDGRAFAMNRALSFLESLREDGEMRQAS